MLIDLDIEQQAELRKLFDELFLTTNIAFIEVICYGNGDEGSIETPDFYDADKNYLPIPSRELFVAVANVSETLIDSTGIDYYNNDGGSGKVIFDIRARTVKVVMSQNETVSTQVYNQTFNLG